MNSRTSSSAPGARSRTALGVALVLAVQLVLALSAQHERVYLDDEVGTWRAVQGSFSSILTSFDERQTQPAYFLLAKLSTLVFGPTELALRLPALAAALGLTLATFLLARRWFGERTAFLAGALVALHPFLLFYAQMARGYTLAMALTVTSLLLTLRMARGEGGARTGVCLVLARAFSVYAHLGAAATFPAELLAALLGSRGSARPGRAAWRTVLWVSAGALLALALYAPMVPGMLEFRERWTGESRGGGFTLGFVPLVVRAYGGGDGLGLTLVWSAALGGLGFAFARRRAAALTLLAWCLAVPLFYAVLRTVHYPWAFARFLTPALPALLIAAAYGLASATARLPGRVALPLALALLFGLACRDDLRIAFGARDAHPVRVFEDVARTVEGDGPGLVILMPVRTHASGPYAAGITDTGLLAVRFEELPALIADGEAEALYSSSLSFLVDLVPAGELRAIGAFEVTEYGSTTRLDLVVDPSATPGERRQSTLAATHAVGLAMARFLEPFEGVPIAGPWVFWRLDARHEHVFAATGTHAAARALVAATARALGREEEAAEEEARSKSLLENAPAPGALGSRFR